MFGIGGSEILVILVVALLFLGPDKLPDAAKQISKGIRDLKKQSRVLQQTIENDEHIGGAIRDLKSALRGDEIRRCGRRTASSRRPSQAAGSTPATRSAPTSWSPSRPREPSERPLEAPATRATRGHATARRAGEPDPDVADDRDADAPRRADQAGGRGRAREVAPRERAPSAATAHDAWVKQKHG